MTRARFVLRRLAAVLPAAVLAAAAVLPAATARAVELPEPLKGSGTVRLAVNATYAPMEYHDPATNELKGLDIDLATEMARRLGVKIAWSDVPFAELIPSLGTGRADFIISGISDRASRRELADFVDYLTTGPQFFVLADSPAKAEADLCGLKVGTVRSTSFPVEIEKWSKAHCEGSGKPAILYVPGENSPDVRNQLKQGRIDAAVQGSETLPYALANEAGRYRVVGPAFGLGFQGIMFRKTDGPLREAVTAVLAAMIADGSYRAILARYDLADNAVPEPKLNASPQ